jgi:hypothetical protein
MTMYVELLSSVHSDPLDALSGNALLECAVARRSEVLDRMSQTHAGAYDALSKEIAYDLALLKLCEVHDIEASVASYSDPRRARAQLEHALGAVGIDLSSRSAISESANTNRSG